MSSPIPRTNSDHVDQNFPFYYSDNLWSIIDDHHSPILESDGCDNGIGLDHIFHGQQYSKLIENRIQLHSSLVPFEASLDTPCPLVHEHNMLLAAVENDGKTSCELNSCEFPSRQKSSALDQGLLKNSITDHGGHNNLTTTLDAFQSLSNCTPEGTSNDTWPLLEEGSMSLIIENHDTEQAEASPVQATPSIDKRLLGKKSNAKTKLGNHKLKQLPKKAVQPNGEEGQISKKQEHNAKEKIRRMKINATYLALGALLPDHRRTKKNRSAPVVIDKALEYIPELEKEVEVLTLRKNNLLSTIDELNLRETPQNVEAHGMSILSASTLQVCKDRVCYHLHIQMNGSSLAADYIAILREWVISWLST